MMMGVSVAKVLDWAVNSYTSDEHQSHLSTWFLAVDYLKLHKKHILILLTMNKRLSYMAVPAPAGPGSTDCLKSRVVWRVLQWEMPRTSLDGWALCPGC